MDWGTWFGWWGGMGIMMLVGMAFMVVFWGGVIFLVVWAISRLTGRPVTEREHGPVDIARERYARGEITKEQYEQIKRDLS